MTRVKIEPPEDRSSMDEKAAKVCYHKVTVLYAFRIVAEQNA